MAGAAHLVRRRIRIAEGGAAVGGEAEAPRGRDRTVRIPKPPRVPDAVEHLGIPQRDLARLARRDGEHPGAHQAMAGQLDQRRIPASPHDHLVDVARLTGVHHLAPQLLIALPQRVVGEHGLAGERIEVRGFVEQRPGVPEPLLDGHACHAACDGHLHGGANLLDPADGDRANGNDRLDPPLGGEWGGEGGGEPEGAEPVNERTHETQVLVRDTRRDARPPPPCTGLRERLDGAQVPSCPAIRCGVSTSCPRGTKGCDATPCSTPPACSSA